MNGLNEDKKNEIISNLQKEIEKLKQGANRLTLRLAKTACEHPTNIEPCSICGGQWPDICSACMGLGIQFTCCGKCHICKETLEKWSR